MKRIFALALVLAMMLSMMVMTASAASVTCEHGTLIEPCTEHPTADHVYIHDVPGSVNFCCVNFSTGNKFNTSLGKGAFTGAQITPAKGMLVLVERNGSIITPKSVCKYPTTPAQPQPKTGVMDTLPIWFGVMAVSACAYVLTSKKRFF